MKAFEDFELYFENLGAEKALNEFPKLDSESNNFNSYQICLMVEALNENYQRTKKEIYQLFTKDETLFIFQSCYNSMYEPSLSSKQLIIANIRDNNMWEPQPIADVNGGSKISTK